MNFKKVKGKIFTSLLAIVVFLLAVRLVVVPDTKLAKLVSWSYIGIGGIGDYARF